MGLHVGFDALLIMVFDVDDTLRVCLEIKRDRRRESLPPMYYLIGRRGGESRHKKKERRIY